MVEALRDCGRPGVGHNCMYDIAYCMAAFVDPAMPASWEQYKVRYWMYCAKGTYRGDFHTMAV